MKSYRNDSASKQLVRDKWVEYIREVKANDTTPLSLVTLPSSEFQELSLYAERGLLKMEYIEETGKHHITEGEIYCFEKKFDRYQELLNNLVGATSKMDDICSYLRTIRPNVLNGKKSVGFPTDVINLDFEGSLCHLKVPLEETIDNIISCQSVYNKQFALFLTFPQSEDTDTPEYKESLATIITNNINDLINTNFKERFEQKFNSFSDLSYEMLHVIGVVKKIVKNSSSKFYKCNRFESVIYGGEDIELGRRKRMHSLLFIFSPIGVLGSHTNIYYDDIQVALNESQIL